MNPTGLNTWKDPPSTLVSVVQEGWGGARWGQPESQGGCCAPTVGRPTRIERFWARGEEELGLAPRVGRGFSTVLSGTQAHR